MQDRFDRPERTAGLLDPGRRLEVGVEPGAGRSGAWPPLRGLLTAFCIVMLAGCGEPLEAVGAYRDQLTVEQMTGEEELPDGPVDNAYFTPVGGHSDALHQLAGYLEVPIAKATGVSGGFPPFRVGFFSHDGHLVPVRRDVIITLDQGTWDLILSPGTVWSEEADNGWSRASFPFVLVGRVWNESHNGLATFLYNDTGTTDLVVQVVQEAASWDQFDGWARLPLAYEADGTMDLDALASEFDREIADRFPVRSWAELDVDIGFDPQDRFDGATVNITSSGLVIDGAFYGQPCRTRYGDYPYCAEMRHGVYSVTKSMGAALSLFWLAEVYGDSVYDELIVDYLDVNAAHDGWDGVTFQNVLDMQTGVGDLAPERDLSRYLFEAEDEGNRLDRFAAASDAETKLDIVFGSGNYRWGPGEVGRYNTMHTFVLAAAMDAYLKREEGPDANLWDRVTEDVLKPLGIHHAPMMHSREDDGSRGIPIMGYGYLPTIGEMAKIASLFLHGGRHEGRQLIDADGVHRIFRNNASVGYEIAWDNEHGRYRYGNSFWFLPFESKGDCDYFIPQMIGYGGNVVQLLPHAMATIMLADGPDSADGNSEGESMTDVADEIRPFCQ